MNKQEFITEYEYDLNYIFEKLMKLYEDEKIYLKYTEDEFYQKFVDFFYTNYKNN